ncbi:MAG TPA: YceI family protein [Bacteroidia bacterium]|jgi:polyisoprenoid-binding protein YceI|nr:YceI family protein [Bacteroidia bacterium]
MKKTLFTTLCLLLVLIGFAQNQQWTIVSSNITFKIKNAGFTVDGKFGSVIGSIQFDATKPSGNKIEASIDANTIDTDNSTRNGHLKKEEYFYVDKFPKINMSTTTITKEANGQFKGLFSLSIKGISKIVPVLFAVIEQQGKTKFAGSFTINRLDYTIGSSSFILSDDVVVSIDVTCVKK